MIDRSNTLIILDWDDTLFPTTWMIKNGIDLNTKAYMFKDLDMILSTTISYISQYGRVIIVTNACSDWIDTTKNVLPKTNDFLRHFTFIYAKTAYEHISPDPYDWKKFAFKEIIRSEFYRKNNIGYINVISIGDSIYEYNALVGLNTFIKSPKTLKAIRFIREPDKFTLMDQLNTLKKVIPKFIHTGANVDKKFIFFHGDCV